MGKFEQSPIETRREVDRSIEQTEAYKGAETLTQLGVLSKMKDVDLFHGRDDRQLLDCRDVNRRSGKCHKSRNRNASPVT